MGLFNMFSKSKQSSPTAATVFGEQPVKNEKSCKDCSLLAVCDNIQNEECKWVQDLSNVFNREKETILLIDDDPGMVSFLEDDLIELHDSGFIDLGNYNLLKFSGPYAAFNFKSTQNKSHGLNVKYAIIDITIGGSLMTDRGNVKYNGIDVFKMISQYTKDFRYLFYTGNSLNTYIKSNKTLIEDFNSVSSDSIFQHVLFKTSLDMDDRRSFIYKILFSSEPMI